jgi:hypothetical protein
MKKFFTFLSLALTLLFVFACDLQLPKAIQIKGSPELKFSTNWEVDIFSNMMESAFGSDSSDQEIHECLNAPEYKTYLIRMEIFNGDVNIASKDVSNGMGGEHTLNEELVLASSDTAPKKLPFSGFGDYLDGFKLKTDDIKSKLYVDGSSEIVTAITIKLSGNVSLPDGSTGKVSQRGSANNAHTLPKLPDGGIDVDLHPDFFKKDASLDIGYKIYLAQGEVIETAWLGNSKIDAELVIWIPMVLEAEKNNAEIKFDSLKGVGDFLISMSESGFIEGLNIAVGMGVNPFKEGKLVARDINNTGFEITNPMSADALNFTLSEKDVEYINENYFDPEFSIRFERQGAVIKIPKIFSVTTISMTAKLNYTVELGDN